MLFNSLPFILVFAPMVISIYWCLAGRENARLWFLVLASIAFYGYWNIAHVPLLVLSLGANWLAAGVFARADRDLTELADRVNPPYDQCVMSGLRSRRIARRSRTRKTVIAVSAIGGNLSVLAFYKYLAFFAATLNQTIGSDFHVTPAELPLGISFFTFHHIIYWVDLQRGQAPFYRLRDYALYIVNFPQILAGPLVRNREIVPQFRLDPWRDGWDERLGRGITLFSIGLAKKAFLADSLATTATEIFAKAGRAPLTCLEAWNGCLSFAFQIYFDFSGYSDMAIGLALMLGMVLPLNFDIPYRAVNLREFWRRWHITLSFFLRDYVYIPLGGSRSGPTRQMFALAATMALGGLWHGAGWTFVLWGLLHGVGLAVCALWQRCLPPLPRPLGWALTLVFVFVGWVLFRAGTLEAAGGMLAGMSGAGGLGQFGAWRTLVIAAAVALLGPSSVQASATMAPRATWAAVSALVIVTALFKIGGGGYEFIYFQF